MTTLKSFGIAAALLAMSGGTAAAQSTTATPMPPCSMMNRGEDAATMTAHRQQMMAEMQAGDKKLDELVALMNTAQGQDRLDRIADVVKQLVDSRRQMADGMMTMMMSASMPMSGMMSGCSMMKPAIGKEEKDGAADDHSAHHPVQK